MARLASTTSAATIVCLLAVAVVWVHPLSSRVRQYFYTHTGAASKQQAATSQAPSPLICAHGGDTTRHPPNTAAAYAAALEAGADCIEIDTALTSDLQLAALHDRDLQKLLGQPAVKVQDFTWSELQGLTWPSGEHLLTVAEAVAHTQQHVQLLILDLKTSADVNQAVDAGNGTNSVTEADAFLAALRLLPLSSSMVIWGKSDELIRRIQQADMNVTTGFSVMRAPGTDFENPLRMQHAQVAAVFHAMLDVDLMQLLQRQQKTVIAWTVDDEEDMRRLLGLGVSGILTNTPALLNHSVQQHLLHSACSAPSCGHVAVLQPSDGVTAE